MVANDTYNWDRLATDIENAVDEASIQLKNLTEIDYLRHLKDHLQQIMDNIDDMT